MARYVIVSVLFLVCFSSFSAQQTQESKINYNQLYKQLFRGINTGDVQEITRVLPPLRTCPIIFAAKIICQGKQENEWILEGRLVTPLPGVNYLSFKEFAILKHGIDSKIAKMVPGES